jgi:16S rRNA (adenine1518-N6/adenine1519-N6)-dimethyltransferase
VKDLSLLDQFFLEDDFLVERFIAELDLNKNDLVLEVGAGNGSLTKVLVKKAKKIIAVEIDPVFKKQLKDLDNNCQIIFDDILLVLKNRQKYNFKFNKIAGNLPSSVVEPLIKLLFHFNFETAVFFLPLIFANKLIKQEPYTFYFKTILLEKVSPSSFSPAPKTNWALVKITPLSKAILEKDPGRYLKQYVYEHPLAKPKNSQREGLIKYYRTKGKKLTKNEARKILGV